MRKFYILLPLLALICGRLEAVAQVLPLAADSIKTTIHGKIVNNNSKRAILMLNGPFAFFGGTSIKDAKKVLVAAIDQKGEFTFKIKTQSSPFHVTLFLSDKDGQQEDQPTCKVIDNYLIEAGDSIKIIFSGEKREFTGPGAPLFAAQYSLHEIDASNKKLETDAHRYFRNDKMSWLREKDSLLTSQLLMLSTYKSRISELAYGIIKADIIGVNRAWLYRRISFAGPFFVAGTPLDKDLEKLCLELQHHADYIARDAPSALSPEYVRYLYDKIRVEAKYNRIIEHTDPFINEDYFQDINKKFSGTLRDKLLAYWLTAISSFNDLHEADIYNALGVMTDPYYIAIAKELQARFSNGQELENYAFQDNTGRTVKISDFRGKIVLIDLWFSGCIPCLSVARGLRQIEKKFENNKEVVFLSISTDNDRSKWLKSINNRNQLQASSYYISAQTKYVFTNGTGQNNSFIKRYVPQGSYPTMLLIDRMGKIYSSTPTHPIAELAQKKLIFEIGNALAEK